MSTKSDGQVVIEIVADDEKAAASLNTFERSVEATGKAAQSAADQVEKAGESLEKIREASNSAGEGLDKVAAASKSAGDHIEKTGNSAKETEKKIEDLGNASEKMQNQMLAVSASCSAVAVALIAVGAEAVQAAMEFDSAFAKTQTIMDQNVMSAKQMREEIMGLSKSSGMSASDVSEAVYQAISGSVATEDATAFVDQANKLAVSGFTSLSNATDVLTTALNAYGLEADTVGGISNVLIQTQNLGKTSVDELASSMGKAISTGSAYGVNLENLSTAYVELTRGGIDTAEATTYISAMLNELGDSGSNVGGILQEKTGKSFGQLMAQGWSLGDVLQVLSDKVDGDAEALMGLWSSQEAGKASNAIMTQSVEDFNAVCAQMQSEMAGATGTTEKAYKTMTSTSEFIDQRFNNSINNLGIAFGDNLSPAVDGVKGLLTGIVEGLTSVVEKYPSISAVVTGLTVGLGVLSVALTAYTLKTKLAKNETLKLTAAMLKNPVMLIITGIAAAAVGIATYAAKTADATEETEKLSAASELQKRELEDLKAEYEAVCEAQGETSAEAQLLKEKIDDQTEAFEKNKKTAQEVATSIHDTTDAYAEFAEQQKQLAGDLEAEEDSTISLISELDELTAAEEMSAGSKQKMLAIVDLLNERIPELGLKFDELSGKLNVSGEGLQEYALNYYKQQKYALDIRDLGTRLGNALELETAFKNASTELDAAKADYEKYYVAFTEYGDSNLTRDQAMDAKNRYATAQNDYNAAKIAYEDNEAEIARLSNELGDAQEETGMLTGEMDAMTSVTDNLTASMEALATAYNEAYEAAYDSITSQYALWDTAAEVVAMDAAAVMAALKSQEEYWNNYNANLNELILRQGEVEGLDEMIAAFGDGSEESVNMIAMMAGMSNDDLAGLVAQFRETSEAEKRAAESLGEASVGLQQRTQEVIDEAVDGVEQLNLSDEARQSGIDTINGYIEGLGELLPDVQNTYAKIGAIIRATLQGDIAFHANPSAYSGSSHISAYASGTYFANSGLALVGEAGPELVYLRGGERILNAEETKAILNTVYPVAPNMAMVGAGAPAIAGRGSVQLHATIAVPVQIDGREFARATAEYVGEEMEFEVM